MNFRRHSIEDPEINLIPLIDVLLVILIFLMLSMTYSRFTALQVDLPVANAERLPERPAEIVVAVAGDGRTMVRGELVDGRNVDALAAAIAAAAAGRDDAFVIVSADALAAHQSVMNVLDASRRAGIVRLTFAAQSGQGR
ncbi:MAG TPA: biopolymer transporter ExbD [Rubrivivax sp.]|jgi:biopolymer transport protein ExbD|nr:biopolymer transporter ExbD [Burkholderiaceae bacterium]MCP5289104.1 biopolymer transporter ExbD [Burkholderiaceae bacterium]HMR71138.1 biopolymer transporter ExbD [Rubrivivax sp.]